VGVGGGGGGVGGGGHTSEIGKKAKWIVVLAQHKLGSNWQGGKWETWDRVIHPKHHELTCVPVKRERSRDWGTEGPQSEASADESGRVEIKPAGRQLRTTKIRLGNYVRGRHTERQRGHPILDSKERKRGRSIRLG